MFGGTVRLEREGETVVVRAAGLRERDGDQHWRRPLERSGRVEIEVRRLDAAGVTRLDTFEAHRAILRVDLGSDWRTRKLGLDLELRNFAPTDLAAPGPDDRTAGIRLQTQWTGLTVAASPLDALLGEPSSVLLQRTREWVEQNGSDPELEFTASALSKRIKPDAGDRHTPRPPAMAAISSAGGGRPA